MWLIQVGPGIVFAAAIGAPAALAAPEQVRSLVEEVSGLSVGAILILLVYMLMRGIFRFGREVDEMKAQRDEWKRLWEQERVLNMPSPVERNRDRD